VALAVLRVKLPDMVRPFRVPGGIYGAVLVGIGPAALIGFALWAARGERVAGLPALVFSGLVAAGGPLVYLLARRGSASA
jgi:hypothetical protein